MTLKLTINKIIFLFNAKYLWPVYPVTFLWPHTVLWDIPDHLPSSKKKWNTMFPWLLLVLILKCPHYCFYCLRRVHRVVIGMEELVLLLSIFLSPNSMTPLGFRVTILINYRLFSIHGYPAIRSEQWDYELLLIMHRYFRSKGISALTELCTHGPKHNSSSLPYITPLRTLWFPIIFPKNPADLQHFIQVIPCKAIWMLLTTNRLCP